MCETKFLQMYSSSITLTSLPSLNLSFPLLSYVISAAVPAIRIFTLVQKRTFPFVTTA